MTFQTIAGSYETARKLVENGLTQYLERIVPSDPMYLAPLFEYDDSLNWGLDAMDNGNGWPVEFENMVQDPALVTAQDRQRPWFSVKVSDNFTQQKAIGRFGYARSYLIGIIDIFVRAGTGTARARSIADELSDWYKNLSSATGGLVVIGGADIPGREGALLGLTRNEWNAVTIRQPEIRNIESQDPEKWFRTRLMMEIEIDRFFGDPP